MEALKFKKVSFICLLIYLVFHTSEIVIKLYLARHGVIEPSDSSQIWLLYALKIPVAGLIFLYANRALQISWLIGVGLALLSLAPFVGTAVFLLLIFLCFKRYKHLRETAVGPV